MNNIVKRLLVFQKLIYRQYAFSDFVHGAYLPDLFSKIGNVFYPAAKSAYYAAINSLSTKKPCFIALRNFSEKNGTTALRFTKSNYSSLRSVAQKILAHFLYRCEKLWISKVIFNSSNAGFGLVEVILAVGIWVILASSAVTMLVGSYRGTRLADEEAQAVNLANEGIDAVYSIKKQGWTSPFLTTNCVTGCGVATVSGTWGYLGTNNSLGKFTRTVFVNPVNRDGAGNIVEGAGTLDPDVYKVTSQVSWGRITPNVTNTVSVVTYLSNFAKSIITSLTGGLVIYGDGTTTPKYRTYDRTANSFSTETSGIIGAAGRSWGISTSPTRTEAIAGYVTSGGVLQIMCFDGTTWTNDWSVTVGGTATTRRFDIAFEHNSGDAIVLYSTNTGTTNELAYRTKAGASGCGSSNWTAAANFNPARTSGTVLWVKMTADDRAGSDIIGAIWSDTNSDLSGALWNGTAWGNEPASAMATSLEVVAAAGDVDDFALDYEALSGDLMVVWAISTGNNGTNGVMYRTCTGGTATCTWSAVLTPPTWRDDATNLDLTANPTSDQMAFASIGNAGSDLQMGYWNGTAWTNRANVDTASGTPLAGTRLVSNGWLINGGTTRIVTAYLDSTGNGISWYLQNPGAAPVRQTDYTTTPAIGYPKKWIDIQMDPIDRTKCMILASDLNNDLFAKKLEMISTVPTFTWSNSDGGSALETSLPVATTYPFTFRYWRN